jgi:putative membrane protein
MLNEKMRYSSSLLGGAAFALASWLAITSTDAAPRSKSGDQHFMTEAIQGDLSEVKMGKLAQEKGQGDNVKQFGKMLEQDHSEHLQQAQQIADKNGLKAPTEPNAKQQRMYQKLNGLSGSQFDKAFAQDMVHDHEEDISKYRKEASSDSGLADFAKQTVPVLEKHLEAAKALTPAR